MKKQYNENEIWFSLNGYSFHVLNLAFEKFTKSIPAHSHGTGCYELHYIPYGFGQVIIDGILYEIAPGSGFLTGPHVLHEQIPDPKDPMQEYCIYIRLEKSGKQHPDPLLEPFFQTPFWIGSLPETVTETILLLFRELEQKQTGYLNQAEALLMRLIIGIIRLLTTPSKEKELPPPASVPASEKHLSVIIEDYFLYEYQSLSLESLALRLSLSPRQTQRLLLKYYGQTFQQKKAEARMSAAAILLGDPANRIAGIAEALGYSSAEHFTTAFRKYYGLSPRSYRKK